MPKTGLAAHEWERRLRLFALGKFEFSRGHPTGSVWAKKRANIQKCPVGKAAVDLFGKKVQFSCGYHPKETATPVCVPSAPVVGAATPASAETSAAVCEPTTEQQVLRLWRLQVNQWSVLRT